MPFPERSQLALKEFGLISEAALATGGSGAVVT